MRYVRKYSEKKWNAGFTLVELIVSVGLFTIVVTIAMTAYLRLISIDRRTRALNDVVTNLSFVVESMSRSIRTGTNYNLDDTGGGNDVALNDVHTKFSFTNDQNQIVTYILVQPVGLNSYIAECISVPSSACAYQSGNEIAITDPRINVTNLTFWTDGVSTFTGGSSLVSSGGDGKQPIAYFTIRGSVKPDETSPPAVFTIESTATQRLLEI